MARELLTSRREFQPGIDRLLALAKHEIQLYDLEIGHHGLEASPRSERLKGLVHSHRPSRLRIGRQDTALLPARCPRLMRLLAAYPSSMSLIKRPDHTKHLRDAMPLVDSRHGLIHFDHTQPRSKLLLDETDKLTPYRKRFEDIWSEDGTPPTAVSLGL